MSDINTQSSSTKKMREPLSYKTLIFVSILAVYLIFVIISFFLMCTFKTIQLIDFGIGYPVGEHIISIEDKKAEHIYYDHKGNETEREINNISDFKLFTFRLKGAFLLVPFWKKEYINPNISDGDLWSLDITTSSGEKYISGSNKAPIGFFIIRKAIYKM